MTSVTTAPPTVKELLQELACNRSDCSCHTAVMWGRGNVHCIAHDDPNPSLTVDEIDRKPLVYCQAGCAQSEVITTLKEKGLWPESKNGAGHPKETAYKIRNKDGAIIAVHVRIENTDANKSFVWRQPNGQSGLNGTRLKDLPLYSIERVGDAKEVFITEGEKACNALQKIGLQAVGTVCGASSIPGDDALRDLITLDRKIILWPDNDATGRSHMEKLSERLKSIGAENVEIIEWPEAPPKGDAADFVAHGGAAEAVRAMITNEAPAIPEPEAEEGDQEGDEKANTATKLVRLADDVDLFHTPDGKGFATLPVKDHNETWPVSGKGFKDFLRGYFYRKYRKPPNSQALADAMGVLQAKAQFEGEEHPVFTRIAWQEGRVSLYLADKSCSVVEIRPSAWRVCDDSDVRFFKSKNLAPMPEPETGGNIEALRAFINIPKEDNNTWRLIVAWLVAAFLEGPFAILAVVGESGCAKTTLTRVLTRLVDPSEADLRSLPKKEQDLMITAVNGWLLAFDNVSGVPGWLSDALCRLSTGSGFSTRTLYADSEETIFKAKRPIILNGIDDMASRGDLLSRTILLSLVPVEKRIDEKEFWIQFEKARPKIFGSLLDILSKVLSILPTLKVSNMPRMADFARIGVAVEQALHWPEGAFLRAYEANRNTSSALPLEGLFPESIIEFMKEKITWEGTATELLSELNEIVDLDRRKNLREWPKTSQIVGNKLRRLAPDLRGIGIDVQFIRIGEKRILKIRRLDRTEKTSSSSSSSSSFHEKSENSDGYDGYLPSLSRSKTTEAPLQDALDLEVEPCE